jgi:conjugal transfer/type IV secretion protein DotA/TraY
MFHTLSATVYAAHSGRSIGQGKYHGLWSPLRILAGVSFLAPIQGYCAAQFLVLKVIVIGYSLANGMWVTYVDRMISADMVSVPTGISVGPGRIAAMRVLEAEACAVTMMAHSGNFRTGPSNWNPLSLFNTGRPVASRPPAAGVPQQRTLARGSGVRQGLRATPEQRAQSSNNSPQIVPGAYHVWDYGTTCGSLRMGHPDRQSGRSPGEEAAFQAFQRAKIQAMSSLVEGVRNTQLPERFMSMVVASPEARPRGDINESGPWYALIAAGEAYDREIEEAGQELVRSLNDAGNTRIRQTASELGWASAGALNMALTRMASEASRYVHNANPEVTPPETDGVSAEGTSATEGMRILRALMANLAAAQREMQGHNIARSEDVQSNRDHASGSAGMAWLRELSQRVAHGMVAHTNLDPLRPMASIQAVGNTALVAGEIAFVAGAAAAWASNTAVGKAAGLDGKFRFVSGIATPIVIGLLIFGALHVYVLPLIPFVIWFFAVIGVASMAVELMIAAPLAALQHIKADGEEFVEQKQQTFYLMAFNALMKPSLLLFGLALSSVMFVVMANFLNQTFGYAMVVSQGDSIVGPVGVVVMLCFSFYLHYQICVKSFSLITQVPAVVSNLIGAPDPQRDEHQQGDVIVAGVANLTRKGVTNTTHAAASKAKGSQQPAGDKPTNGAAPGGNGAALSPASAKGGAAPAGNPKGNE